MSLSGIDPGLLKSTNDALQAAGETLRSGARGLKSDCDWHGVATQQLQEISAIGAWVADQLPMLRRRQNLASAMSARDGHVANGAVPPGIVWVPDQFLTSAQAAKEGQELAARLRSELEKDGKVSDETLAELQANAWDPDYTKGLYDKLGPEGLCVATHAIMASDYYQKNPARADELAKALGTGLATHSRVVKLDADWLKKFTFPKGEYGSHAFQGGMLGYLMLGVDGGAFDAGFLHALGNHMFRLGMGEGVPPSPVVGSWKGDAYTQFTRTIAQNPTAAAHVFHDNFDTISEASKEGHVPDLRGAALAELVKAATIEVRTVDTRLAETNVARLLLGLNNHPNERTFAAMEGVYGEIAHTYFGDLAYSVTSLTPTKMALVDQNGRPLTKWDENAFHQGSNPLRPGLELPEALWRTLLRQGMRDPRWAAGIAADFQAYVETSSANVSDVQGDQDNLVHFQNGVMQGFYRYNFALVSTDLEGQAAKWVEDTNAARESLIKAGFTVAAGAIQPGAVAAKATDATFGILSDLGTTLLAGVFDVDAKDVPKRLRDQLRAMESGGHDTSWQASYVREADRAGTRFLSGKIQIEPVTGPGGVLYDGKPDRYIDGEARRNFFDPDGSVVPLASMTPSQADAYAQWLSDPAIVARVVENFAYEEGGKNSFGNGG